MTSPGIEIGTSLRERTPVSWPWRRDGQLLNGLIEGPVGSGKTVLLKRIEDAAFAAGGWNVVHYDAARQPRRLNVFADAYLVPERTASAVSPTLLKPSPSRKPGRSLTGSPGQAPSTA